MPQAVIITPQTNSKHIRTSLAVTTSYPSTITPITSGLPDEIVFNSVRSNGNAWFTGGASLLHLIPFCQASNSTGMGMRVMGYNYIQDPAEVDPELLPTLIADFNLSYTTSGSGAPDWSFNSLSSFVMAAVTQVAGTPAANIYSPGTAAAANREAAHVLVDMTGFQIVNVQFKAATNLARMGAFARVI
jgi:hypothetical protein